MKADVFSLRAPERPVREFTLTDPANPGVNVVLRLKKYGVMGLTAFESRAQEMFAKYVTGSGPLDKDGNVDTKSTAYQPPKVLPAIDGQAIELSYATCRLLASIEKAQVTDEDESYGFHELAALTVSDGFALGLMECAGWVMPDEPRPLEVTDGDPPVVSTPSPSLTVSEGSDGTLSSTSA